MGGKTNTTLRLQTARLTIEELSLTDLESIHQLHLLPETNEFNTRGAPETIEVTELLLDQWIEQQNINPRASYILALKKAETNHFVGLIGLILGKPKYKIAEVWYKTHPDYWKQGYTTEALSKLIDFGFTSLGLHRIEAGTAVENLGSIKVLERVGMTKEGLRRKLMPIEGKWIDNFLYSILDEDFGREFVPSKDQTI